MSGFPSPSFADARDEFRAHGGCPTSLNQRQPCFPFFYTMDLTFRIAAEEDAAYWEDFRRSGQLPPRLGEASAGTRWKEVAPMTALGHF